AEKQPETSIHQYLVDEPTHSWLPSSTRASEAIRSTSVSHYELQVEIGRGFGNWTSVHLAWPTPTGTLVTTKITNLEDCTDERLKALQKAVILSHLFRHPNITAYWTVFTVGSWLWVISPFTAYGSASQLLRTYFPEGMTCELASGQVPFQDMHRTQMLLQKLKGPPYSPLDINPEKRPSASYLLSHVFFKQMKKESQDSILSVLPPACHKPSTALPPASPWTEPECDFPDEKAYD
ncbi:hypothetical protein HPG69_007927, partial [Diceros bicornis minor]